MLKKSVTNMILVRYDLRADISSTKTLLNLNYKHEQHKHMHLKQNLST